MNSYKKFKLLFQTVRHMKIRQWIYRLYYYFRNVFFKKRKSKKKSVKSVRPISDYYNNLFSTSESSINATNICNNIISTVSGINLKFDKRIDWNQNYNDYRLIAFKLNSFDYLKDLAREYNSTNNIKFLKKGFDLIDNWNEENGIYIQGDKWNPYVIATRIMNWIGFVSKYSNICKKNVNVYSEYIASQACELNSSIEYHLGANHVLSESKSLMYAGAFLKNPKYYNKGKKILQKEYKTQFRTDGSHYEQSISYHVESLQQYFESYALMQLLDDCDAIEFAKMLNKPYEYLYNIMNADETIPLVNDAAIDYPIDASDFLSTSELIFDVNLNLQKGCYYNQWSFIKKENNLANWKSNFFHENSHYLNYHFKINNKRYSLFFDAGNAGPDENLGHAHADQLSILLYDDKGPLLTDSGVFTYANNVDRNMCRSTCCHNTLTIDNKNNMEVWSSFRVGKRGHTKVLEYKDEHSKMTISAVYDGYKKILKDRVYHIRTVVLFKKTGKIEVIDEIKCNKNHTGELNFIFSPNVNVSQIDDNNIVFNDWKFTCSKRITVTKGIVAAKFGIKENSKKMQIVFPIEGYTKVVSKFMINKEV